jgi:hypothetical protein
MQESKCERTLNRLAWAVKEFMKEKAPLILAKSACTAAERLPGEHE